VDEWQERVRSIFLLQHGGPSITDPTKVRLPDSLKAKLQDRIDEFKIWSDELPEERRARDIERRLIQTELLAYRAWAISLITRKNRGRYLLDELMLQHHRLTRRLANATPGNREEIQEALHHIEARLDEQTFEQIKREKEVEQVKRDVEEHATVMRARCEELSN